MAKESRCGGVKEGRKHLNRATSNELSSGPGPEMRVESIGIYLSCMIAWVRVCTPNTAQRITQSSTKWKNTTTYKKNLKSVKSKLFHSVFKTDRQKAWPECCYLSSMPFDYCTFVLHIIKDVKC